MNITILLDETGSMIDCLDATINGYNEYLETIKTLKRTTVTLVKFNSEKLETVYNGVKVKDAIKLSRENYVPNYFTPLYDSIARTILEVDKVGDKDNIFVILTDGLENASMEYDRKQVFNMIKERDTWKFIYLGANQDAYMEGNKIGIISSHSYSVENTGRTFGAVGSGVYNYAMTGEFDDKEFENLL